MYSISALAEIQRWVYTYQTKYSSKVSNIKKKEKAFLKDKKLDRVAKSVLLRG